MTLTPALCATLLRPVRKSASTTPRAAFFGWFNRSYSACTRRTSTRVRGILARTGRYMAIYAALAALMGVLFIRLPTVVPAGRRTRAA